ncbi:MAG: hypothetical protein JSS02_16565, partial [Planctomycetes bacterium]|nr:hypothetical protein [Planctomycetota bacterium]
MKLINALKSLSWTSLFQSARTSRLRRRRTSGLVTPLMAEVLEVRALLSSSNVTASVVGTALTLTSDNSGDHSVTVYRKDATHIEIDGIKGTTINNNASAIFTLSS